MLVTLGEGDGKVLLTSESILLNFSVSFETLLGVPSIELYAKHIGEFLEFKNFENKTGQVIYGDFLRFEAASASGEAIVGIDRLGWIKSKTGRYAARIQTAPGTFNGRSAVVVHYWVADITSDLVPAGLPTFWGPTAKLVVNLWQHERLLFMLLLTLLLLLSTFAFVAKLGQKPPTQTPPVLSPKPLLKHV
jgi:hypothetical protein